jgi:ADP-heptose:LPS heptosyltransferase
VPWLILLCLTRRKKANVIWRTAALGDVVCTMPLAAEIRRLYPDHLLIFITLRGFRDVVLLGEIADAVYGIDYQYGKPSWVPFIKGHLSRFITRVDEPQTTDERTNSKSGAMEHLIDDLAHSCDITLSEQQPRLFPPPALMTEVQTRFRLREPIAANRLIIGINGGPTWPVREWSMANWQVLVEKLQARYDPIVLQFGLRHQPGAGERNSELTGVVPLIGLLSVRELVALIASCRLIISIDSGPIHVAGAVGTPVVGLFGAVNPLYRLPPASAAVGLVTDVPCLFCHHRTPIEHWRTGCPHDIRCMKLLEPEAVFNTVVEMLERPPAA